MVLSEHGAYSIKGSREDSFEVPHADPFMGQQIGMDSLQVVFEGMMHWLCGTIGQSSKHACETFWEL